MIKNLDRDMNRSRDVKGPELKRPHDKEIKMGKQDFGGGLEDYADTGTLSKHDLSELHHGDHEGPLTAAGQQDVVVAASMGRDSAGGHHKPNLAKGSTKDEQHHGRGGDSYSKDSKSLGSHSKGTRMPEPKGAGRSIAKKLGYAAKAKMK